MELFLKEQNEKLKNADEPAIINVVLGNESCDLDSTISSIIFAYFLYKARKLTDITIPVLNVKRDDLYLRTEVIFFLKKSEVSLSDLICIDEIDLKVLKDKGKLNLFIVDHNELSTEQSNLHDNIIEIIDHHQVNDARILENKRCKIETVGSCCTLVAEEILEFYPAMLDHQIALLLYGTILLDTVCLKESAKRVTDKDINIASQLETYLTGINKEQLFEELQIAKFDVSNLSPRHLLKKDTKFVKYESTVIAIASVPVLLETIVEKEEFVSALHEMQIQKNLTFILVLGSEILEYSIRRQIIVYDKCEKYLEKISDFLLNLDNPSLDLHPLSTHSKFIRIFEQKNSALSRKFLLPAMQQYIKFMYSDCNM